MKEGSETESRLRDLGLADVVTFVSGVTDERIVELYSEAELAVVPSLYEGFSLPAIEAMSSGTTLVATTGGALPEVTGPHNETCLQVPPGDSEALAAMMTTALDAPELRERIGAAGRQRVIDHWSWRHTAERTVQQYETCWPVDQAAITSRPRQPRHRPEQTERRGIAVLTVDYEVLGLHAGDRLLDIGCGFGRHSYEALRRGAMTIASDYSLDGTSGGRGNGSGHGRRGRTARAIGVGVV